MKTYSSYLADIPRIINNSLTDNVTWATETLMDSLRYLITKYYFNERTYLVPGGTVAQTQFYNLPPQVKKIINMTVTIGSVVWQPKECPTRQYWDALNVITFYQDFPSFFFIYNGKVGIYPIPSSSSNPITINYKTRITDLSMADVTSTVAVTTNTTTVTGTGFVNWMADQWIRIAHSATNANNGDNQWYQIDSITNATTLVLKNPYSGATVTAGTATIGEVPILPEDYQDLPLYRMAMIYYATRFPDAEKYREYKELYDTGFAALDAEFGAKTTNVQLTDTDAPLVQPNLFQRNITAI